MVVDFGRQLILRWISQETSRSTMADKSAKFVWIAPKIQIISIAKITALQAGSGVDGLPFPNNFFPN